MNLNRREWGVRALWVLGQVGMGCVLAWSGTAHAGGEGLVDNDPASMKNTADRPMKTAPAGPGSPAAAPEPATVVVPRDVLDLLKFENAGAELRASSARGVEAIFRQWKASPSNTVVALKVHAESDARVAEGMALANARAKKLLDALVTKGIAAAAVRTRGVAAATASPRLPPASPH